MLRRVAVVVSPGIALMSVSLGACADEPEPFTRAEYLAALEAICTDTAAELEALPSPPNQISVADFATSAAGILDDEAERARLLELPAGDSADGELDDDHRAFVRNTEEQAQAWRAIAEGDGDLGDLTVLIGELVRGRNDLADEMGAPACRRGEV
jgi:hypothetical protein